MGQLKIGDNTVHTNGDLPSVGSPAPDFALVKTDMTEVSLKDFAGRSIVLNIFPSVDTSTCATSVREFNKRAAAIQNASVLCISKDLPYAFRRFCAAEGIQNVISLSDFRNKGFSDRYGVLMTDGRMAGLHARAVVVIGPDGKVKYTELVPVIGQEPDYDKALNAL